MAMETINELFEHELNDMLNGETQLLDALQESAGESTNREIKKAFLLHRKETQGQIKRLRQVFKIIGSRPEEETCRGIEGLIREKKAFTRERPSAELLDFFSVGAAQKVERYEISSYEGLIEMARKLGFPDAAELLEENLQEEEATLNKLKALESDYDTDALMAMEEEEEEEEAMER